MTYVELGIRVLKEEKKWLDSVEIWDLAEKKGYTKELDTYNKETGKLSGKTPIRTLATSIIGAAKKKKKIERKKNGKNIWIYKYIDSDNSEKESVLPIIETKNLRLDIQNKYQEIIYGAPGTGKSQLLKKRINKDLEKNVERVTFYDGYNYANFVGAYRPTPNKENKSDITYEFVAGPLFRILLKAFKNPNSDFILVIEEINRAKADKVFGNIFQLLDRTKEGESEYPISLSEEQDEYFRNNLEEYEYYENFINNKLLFPKNLYIWATMNSADQGVYPMDSAFKRRWNFKYIGLDENEGEFGNSENKYEIKEGVSWNNFRKTVNKVLLDVGISEDRLLAPFFVKPEDFESDGENKIYIINKDIFESKVLMYLFDDVLRHRGRDKVFNQGIKSFSNLIEKYKKEEKIFSEKIEFLNSKTETEE